MLPAGTFRLLELTYFPARRQQQTVIAREKELSTLHCFGQPAGSLCDRAPLITAGDAHALDRQQHLLAIGATPRTISSEIDVALRSSRTRTPVPSRMSGRPGRSTETLSKFSTMSDGPRESGVQRGAADRKTPASKELRRTSVQRLALADVSVIAVPSSGCWRDPRSRP